MNMDNLNDENVADAEITMFLLMCSEKDREFLTVPKGERKEKDYVRLMLTALIFGLKAPFLRLLREAEKAGADILPELEARAKDFPAVRKWVEEFLAAVPDGKMRDYCRNLWQEKLAKVDEKNFIVSNLF